MNCATSCVKGKCAAQDVTGPQPGSCSLPVMLGNLAQVNGPDVPADTSVLPVMPFGASFTVDVSTGADHVKAECGASGIRDVIIQFHTPDGVGTLGFEIRFSGFDTVAEIRPWNGQDCKDIFPYPTGTCSDDAIPPGGFGSRLFGQLEYNKDYIIVATAYSDQSAGPGLLELWFNPAPCTPQCEV